MLGDVPDSSQGDSTILYLIYAYNLISRSIFSFCAWETSSAVPQSNSPPSCQPDLLPRRRSIIRIPWLWSMNSPEGTSTHKTRILVFSYFQAKFAITERCNYSHKCQSQSRESEIMRTCDRSRRIKARSAKESTLDCSWNVAFTVFSVVYSCPICIIEAQSKQDVEGFNSCRKSLSRDCISSKLLWKSKLFHSPTYSILLVWWWSRLMNVTTNQIGII